MNFTEAYMDDLENAFFNEDEFAGRHVIDGEECIIVLIETKRADAKMSYGLMRSTLNPKETAINKISHIIYIKEKDVKRKFSVNAMIELDGKKLFIQDILHQKGMYRLAVGGHAV